MFELTRSIFSLILLLGPPEGEAPPPDDLFLTSDEVTYERTIEQLGYGITFGDEQPEKAIAVLEDALAVLPRFTPQLANDPGALVLRAEAYVSLARAYLTVKDEAKARAALDEGVRSAPVGHALPVNIYGPRVEKLWKQKQKAGESPRQDVVVNCWVACRVYLNERSIEAGEPINPAEQFAMQAQLVDLKAGRYRLWIEAADGSIDPWLAEFEPRAPGEPPLDFTFGTKPAPEPPALVGPKPAPLKPTTVEPRRDRPNRLLPLPVEISAMVAGVGLIASGVVLFAIDGKCANDAATKDAVPADGRDVCPSVWTTKTAGLALIGSGAGLSAAGSILIGIDEVRAAKDKKAARLVVGWTFRF